MKQKNATFQRPIFRIIVTLIFKLHLAGMRQNFKTTLAIVVVLLGLVNGNFNLVTLLIDCTDDKIELKLYIFFGF